MTIKSSQTPVAWPRARAGYVSDPAFHAKVSAQHQVDMSGVLHAVPSRMRSEYVDALRMYCAGQPALARGYLLRAEYVYKTYGRQENYDLVSANVPDEALYNRGRARTWAAWVELALHDRWEEELLRSGLQDWHQYLMEQSYDATCAYAHEDEDRLFTVLCQMALGQFKLAEQWLTAYVKHRKARKFKENFPELLAGIQVQLEGGSLSVADPFKMYFDQNRLGNFKFAEAQAFWLCVPMAVVMERVAAGWRGVPGWDAVLDRLLY